MQTLYISRSSISVKLEQEHLVLHDHAQPGRPPGRVPLADVARVVVSGQPAISFPVLAKLMDLGVPCSFLTAGGRWRGVLDGDRGFHAERRKRQYDSLADEEFTLVFARRVIEAKIRNCRRTLQRLAKDRGLVLSGIHAYDALAHCRRMVAAGPTLEMLRGLEGLAAARYFEALSRFFPPSAPFTARVRRPPPDPANAMLSFAYALLCNEMEGAVRAHGLDVSAGYVHRNRSSAPSLALDLMEPFRPGVADRLVLDLLNHGRIDPHAHFEGCEDGGCRLTEKGRGVFFRAFDEAMARRAETDAGCLTLRQRLDRDVCAFLALLEKGEGRPCFRVA